MFFKGGRLPILEWLLVALVAARPSFDVWRDTSVFTVGSFAVTGTIIFAALAFLLTGALFIRYRHHLHTLTSAYALIAFAGFAFLTIAISQHLALSLVEFIKLLTLVLLFLAGYCLVAIAPNAEKVFLEFAVIGAIVPLGVGLAQWLSKTGLTIDAVANRAYGTFAHPNILALFALWCLLFLVRGREKYHLSRTSFALGLVTCISVILATQARVAWVALSLTLIYFLAHWRSRVLIFGAAAIVVFYGLLFPLPLVLHQMGVDIKTIPFAERLASLQNKNDSFFWRLRVLQSGVGIGARQPFTGFGFGTFEPVWATYKDAARKTDLSNEAHDDYLRIFVETGVIGLGLYLFFFRTLIVDAIQHRFTIRGRNTVFLLSVGLYAILAMSENMLHHTAVAWWIWFSWGLWSAPLPKNN